MYLAQPFKVDKGAQCPGIYYPGLTKARLVTVIYATHTLLLNQVKLKNEQHAIFKPDAHPRFHSMSSLSLMHTPASTPMGHPGASVVAGASTSEQAPRRLLPLYGCLKRPDHVPAQHQPRVMQPAHRNMHCSSPQPCLIANTPTQKRPRYCDAARLLYRHACASISH